MAKCPSFHNTYSRRVSAASLASSLIPPRISHFRVASVQEMETHYTKGEKLGEGSFGTVFKVTDNRTGEIFACKQICKDKTTKTAMKMIEREVDILKHVEHEHIIRLKEVYETNSRMMLIMELCMGGELSELVKKKKEPFTESEIKTIIERLASALAYLHKNDMVHRDIKMENILLAQNPSCLNDNLFIKVTDFGLSIVKGGLGQDNMLSEFCGTPVYMAPEILEQNKAYSEKCDVWAMGIIMLTFDGNSLNDEIKTLSIDKFIQQDKTKWSNTSAEAKDCLKGMLNIDPAHRLTAGEVLEHPWLIGKSLGQFQSRNILQLMQEVHHDKETVWNGLNDIKSSNSGQPLDLNFLDENLVANHSSSSADVGKVTITNEPFEALNYEQSALQSSSSLHDEILQHTQAGFHEYCTIAPSKTRSFQMHHSEAANTNATSENLLVKQLPIIHVPSNETDSDCLRNTISTQWTD